MYYYIMLASQQLIWWMFTNQEKKNPAENSIADCLFPRSQSLQRLLIVIKCQNIYKIFLRIKSKGNLEIGIDHNLFQMNTSRSLLWIKPMQSVAYEPMTFPPNFNFGMIEELHVLLSDCKTGLRTTCQVI